MFARLAAICLLATLAGCGKRPVPPPPPAESTATAPVPASEPSAGARPVEAAPVAARADDAQTAALLNELTQVVRRYGVEQRRVPKTLDELVANGYLASVPPAPAGKKFAIGKKLEVYLANP